MFGVAWGANQFASLLLAYRQEQGMPATAATGLFGFYALGLIPALLLGGPFSDRIGRRIMARTAVVTSVLATIVLAAGVEAEGWLFVGRFLAGVASGLIFAPGTAWVKELSGAPFDPTGEPDRGARRAAISLSAGFSLGPLVAGGIAQWAPAPLVLAYVPHLVIITVAGMLAWRVPETVTRSTAKVSVSRRLLVRSASSPRFLGVVSPVAPWVFAAPAISITIGPALVAAETGSFSIAFAGVVAGLTLGTGVFVQPLAHRLDVVDDVRALVAGLAAVVLGCLVEALTAITGQPVLAVVAAVLTGSGYGLCLVGGLLETQRIAGPAELAALTGRYYALTYVGFAAPVILTALTIVAGYPILLLGTATLALLTMAFVVRNSRRRDNATD